MEVQGGRAGRGERVGRGKWDPRLVPVLSTLSFRKPMGMRAGQRGFGGCRCKSGERWRGWRKELGAGLIVWALRSHLPRDPPRAAAHPWRLAWLAARKRQTMAWDMNPPVRSSGARKRQTMAWDMNPPVRSSGARKLQTMAWDMNPPVRSSGAGEIGVGDGPPRLAIA